ncbi:tyrosine-type recombinase/integrase [Bradyrhizobium sp.]|uniref:tyrosine-type recombinase/integrase n=1 Tax=Bradyrhizobium sp. TaxID=376 RepID=UPI003C79CFC9
MRARPTKTARIGWPLTRSTSLIPWRACRPYALANKGVDTRAIQDWLGHRSIAHTTRYTELSPVRFKDFWRE